MGVSSIAGPAFQIGSSLASGAKGSSGNPDQSGGVTPEQEALADYGLNQDLLKQGSEFANTGTGMSTMATQGAGGAEIGKALSLAKSSDADEAAYEQASQVQQGNLSTSLNSLANQQSQQSATSDYAAGASSVGGNTGATA